ncbi:hypothetical protein ACJJIR_14660 [Microbulbifer sp. SSSA008]|uniref:hypothetical protein n=1 Tax=Microbulbifer sp. SSSA008 TaxID=3243380 RepID=UPI004039F706
MEKEPLSRELGSQEALFIELTNESYDGTQLISCVRLRDSVTFEQFCRGFTFIHRRHPMLRARAKKGTKASCICDVEFEKVPLIIKHLNKSLEYEIEYLWQQNQFVDIENCAYGITLQVNVNDEVEWVIIVSNHTALDGQSRLVLFCDLDRFQERKGGYIGQEPKLLRKSTGEYFNLFGFKDVDLFNVRKSNSCSKWKVEQAVPIIGIKGYSTLKLISPEAVSVFAAQCISTFPEITVFPVGICVSNTCNMQQLAGGLKYFEIGSGIVAQVHVAHLLIVITYTTCRNTIFVFGYCEPLTSHESAHLYVESYLKLVKSLLVDECVQ